MTTEELTARFEAAVRKLINEHENRDSGAIAIADDELHAVFADALAFDPMAGMAIVYGVGEYRVHKVSNIWFITWFRRGVSVVWNGKTWALTGKEFDTAAEAIAVAKGLGSL